MDRQVSVAGAADCGRTGLREEQKKKEQQMTRT